MALIEFNDDCDPYTQVLTAQSLNAIGVVGYSPTGALQQMNCETDAECNNNLVCCSHMLCDVIHVLLLCLQYGSIFGFTVRTDDGEALKSLLLSIRKRSTSRSSAGLL